MEVLVQGKVSNWIEKRDRNIDQCKCKINIVSGYLQFAWHKVTIESLGLSDQWDWIDDHLGVNEANWVEMSEQRKLMWKMMLNDINCNWWWKGNTRKVEIWVEIKFKCKIGGPNQTDMLKWIQCCYGCWLILMLLFLVCYFQLSQDQNRSHKVSFFFYSQKKNSSKENKINL